MKRAGRISLLILVLAACGYACGCGGRRPPILDQGLIPGDLSPALDSEPDAGTDDLLASFDGNSSDGGDGCLTGVVTAGGAVQCSDVDQALDCLGHLCVEVFTTDDDPPPGSAIGRRCFPHVDLSASKSFLYTLAFDLSQAPPGNVIWIGAFLSELNPSPQAPEAGDLFRSPPVSVPTASSCVAVPIVLNQRFQ